MTTALVVGIGAVGTRTVRQLLDTPGVERVLLADTDTDLARAAAEAFGDRAEASSFVVGDPVPAGVDVVACALPTGIDHAVVHAAISAGVPAVSSDDDHDAIDALRSLEPNATAAGVTVGAGCGLAPGLVDVLAAHAAAAFKAVDEIRVARTGWAGPASVASVRRARRASVRSWRQHGWHEDHPHGESLVWFPDPIGARDCRPVTGGSALLVDAFPDVPRVSVLLGEPPKRTRWRRQFGDDGQWGGARVEVWGARDDTHDCVVYGVVERTAIAAGTVLAVAAALLAGRAEGTVVRPGVHGLAVLTEPRAFLAELAARGVRAAVFEGAPPT